MKLAIVFLGRTFDLQNVALAAVYSKVVILLLFIYYLGLDAK